jgi:hypothetical protein
MFSLYYLGTDENPAEWMKDKDGNVFVFTYEAVARVAKKHLETPEEEIEVRVYDGDSPTVHPKMEKFFDAHGGLKPMQG